MSENLDEFPAFKKLISRGSGAINSPPGLKQWLAFIEENEGLSDDAARMVKRAKAAKKRGNENYEKAVFLKEQIDEICLEALSEVKRLERAQETQRHN